MMSPRYHRRVATTLAFDTPAEAAAFFRAYGVPDPLLLAIRADTQALLKGEQTIMATEQTESDLLTKIDGVTTKMGAQQATLATSTQSISDALDALALAQKQAGVSDALVAQTTALADHLQTVSDAQDALATSLAAVATKGAADLTPVPLPPAPAPVVVPTGAP
jgi:hypothetical protein